MMKKVNLKDLKVESFVTSLEQKDVKGGRPLDTWRDNTCQFSYCIGVCFTITWGC
jgi:hypothetical protein